MALPLIFLRRSTTRTDAHCSECRVASVVTVLTELPDGVHRIAATLKLGGTLTYVAAGNSGLMALAD